MAVKKSQFKKILIHEDKTLFEGFNKQLKEYMPMLKDLKKRYQLLEMGPFSNKVFKDLLKGGMVQFVKTYEAFIEKELDKSETTKNRVLRNRIKDGIDRELIPLSNSLDKLKRFEPRYSKYDGARSRLDLRHISYNDRLMVFWISNEDSERLKEEHCRTYIESEQEKKVYDSLEKVRKAYLEFKSNAEPFRGHWQYDAGELGYLLPMNDGEPQISTMQFKTLINNGRVFKGFGYTMASTKAKQGVKSPSSSHSITVDNLL